MSKIKTVSESSVSGNDSESAMSADSDDDSDAISAKIYKNKGVEKAAEKQESQVIQAVNKMDSPDFQESVATEMKTATEEIGKGDEMPGDAKTETPTVEKVDISHAKALGKMPKKEVVRLEMQVRRVEQKELTTKANAQAECKKAKHKVRDDDGSASQEARMKAADAAIKFCEASDKAVKEMEAEDEKHIGETVAKEAKKYGLKVSKVGGDSAEADSKDSKPTTAVEAEDAVFKSNIGVAADEMSDPKAGTKLAKHEAMAKQLDKKLDESKATIVKNLSEQNAKVEAQCSKARASINALSGKKKADARAAKLERAIAFCKKAEAILSAEKKKDFQGLEDVREKEYKSLGLESPQSAALKKEAEAEAKAHPEKVIAMDKEMVKISKEEEANANSQAEKQEKKEGFVDGAAPVSEDQEADKDQVVTQMSKSEDTMKVKVAVMCKQMQDKVETLTNPKKQAKSMKEATAFCLKAKGLLAKQVKKDEAALGSGMKQEATMDKEDSKQAQKARIMKAEEAATSAESHLKKASEDQIAKRTKELKKATGAKIEDLAYKREQAIAEESIKKRAAMAPKKPETAEEQKKIHEELANNKHAQKIMKSLMANKKALAMIEDVLSEFEAMA